MAASAAAFSTAERVSEQREAELKAALVSDKTTASHMKTRLNTQVY